MPLKKSDNWIKTINNRDGGKITTSQLVSDLTYAKPRGQGGFTSKQAWVLVIDDLDCKVMMQITDFAPMVIVYRREGTE